MLPRSAVFGGARASRAREMRVLSDALTADEIGTDRRRGHAVQTASDADLDDDLDAGLDDDIDD